MEVTEVVGPIVLFLLMFVVGLELTLADFGRVLQRPWAVVGGTLGQWLLLPLMTWVVVALVGVRPVFGVGAVLVAVSPGAGISNVLVALGRGNTALSVTLTATASAFAVLTLPTLSALGVRLFIDEPIDVDVPVAALIGQLMLALLLPIGLGMTLRTRYPAEAVRLAPLFHRLTMLAIVLFVGVAITFAPEDQLDFAGSGRAVVAALAWTVCAAAIGWLVAAALRLPGEDRFTFVVEFSARNVAVASIVALSGLGRVDFSFFGGVYVAVAYPMVITAVLLRRRLLAGRRRESAR